MADDRPTSRLHKDELLGLVAQTTLGRARDGDAANKTQPIAVVESQAMMRAHPATEPPRLARGSTPSLPVDTGDPHDETTVDTPDLPETGAYAAIEIEASGLAAEEPPAVEPTMHVRLPPGPRASYVVIIALALVLGGAIGVLAVLLAA